MISGWLLALLAVAVLFFTGFITLAAFKDVLYTLDRLLVISLSWLTGVFVIGFSYLLVLLLSFAGVTFNLLFVILLPLLILSCFNKKITRNTKGVIKAWINNPKKADELPVNRLKTFELFLLILFPLAILLLNAVKPAWAWDAFMIWSLKAKLLFFNSFDLNLLNNYSYDYAHLDYPLLVPLIQAFIAKFTGVFDERYTQIFFSITYISFMLMLLSFIKQFIKTSLAVLLVASMGFVPVLVLNFTGAYVDGIVCTYHLMAIYFLYLYLKNPARQWKYLVPVCIASAAMLMTKNEGTLILLTMAIISALTTVLFTKNVKVRLQYLILTFVVTFLFHLPWVLLNKSLGIANRFISLNILKSENMAEQLAEIPKIIEFLFVNNMFKLELWGILFYIFIIFLVIGIIQKYYFELCLFIGALLINLAGVTLTYVISPHDVFIHMSSSFDRVLLSLYPLVICYIISTIPKKRSLEENEIPMQDLPDIENPYILPQILLGPLTPNINEHE